MIPFAAPTFGKGSTVAASLYSNLTFRSSTFDDTSQTTYTFASSAIGTAAANRWVIVGVLGSQSSIDTITSVTVGGVPATELITKKESGAASSIRVSLYIVNVTTGTTASIVVTWGSSMLACAVGWWTVNMNSGSAHFTGSGASLNSSTVAVTSVAIPANSFAIACAGRTDDDAATIDQSFAERFESTSAVRMLTGDDREVTTSFTGTVTWTFSGSAIDDNAAVVATFSGDGS